MSNGRVYDAQSADGGAIFSNARGLAEPGNGPGNHPLVLVNSRGEIFFA